MAGSGRDRGRDELTWKWEFGGSEGHSSASGREAVWGPDPDP